MLLLAMHIPERLAAACYLLWSFLTNIGRVQQRDSFARIYYMDVIFVTKREDVNVFDKVKTKRRRDS